MVTISDNCLDIAPLLLTYKKYGVGYLWVRNPERQTPGIHLQVIGHVWSHDIYKKSELFTA